MPRNHAAPTHVHGAMSRARSVVPFAMVTSLVAACAQMPFLQTQGPPAHAQAQGPGPDPMVEALRAWRAAGISDYTWQIRFSCECTLTDPLEVTVVDGNVTRVRTPTADVPLANVQGLPLTVDTLLQSAIDAERAGGTAGATWPSDNGVPSELHTDPDPNAVDDERSITVSRFDPVP